MAENMEGEKVIETLNPPGNDETTIKEGVKIDAEAGISSIPDMSHGDGESDLISTLDGGGEKPKADVVAETKPEEDKGSEEVKKEEPDKDDEAKDTRFDKHPRFQELLERAITAETKIKALEERAPRADTALEKDYVDILSMEDDKIREQFDADPKSFLSNFAKQTLDEIRTVIKSEFQAESYQDKTNATHINYAEKHQDFVPMLNDGRIANFINAHPGHNALSAHQELTFASRVKAIEDTTQTKIDEAVKKVKEEMKKDQLVKREPIPAGAHGGSVPIRSNSEGEQILKDSKKAGGNTMALLKKLRLDRTLKSATG